MTGLWCYGPSIQVPSHVSCHVSPRLFTSRDCFASADGHAYLSHRQERKRSGGRSSMPATPAPGDDEITVSLLRLAWPSLAGRLTALCQAALRLGHHPQPFRSADVVFIPKPGKRDRSLPKAYRPISLLRTIGKGIERLVAKRLSWGAIRYKLLHPQQFGALPLRSSADLTTCLVHDIEEAWAKDKKTITSVLTIDIKGAFNAVLPEVRSYGGLGSKAGLIISRDGPSLSPRGERQGPSSRQPPSQQSQSPAAPPGLASLPDPLHALRRPALSLGRRYKPKSIRLRRRYGPPGCRRLRRKQLQTANRGAEGPPRMGYGRGSHNRPG